MVIIAKILPLNLLFNDTSSSSNTRPGFNPNKSYSKNIHSVQCRVCKGMGHYANECANVLRRIRLVIDALINDEEID